MRIVLDTNVLVSGLMFPSGAPGRIVGAGFDAQFDVVSSREQLEEIARVLAYPKIRRVLKWDEHRVEQFVEGLYLKMDMVTSGSFAVEDLRDATDLPILAALVSANADVLVTGDRDLLVLRDRYNVETPAEFLQRLST